MQRQRKRERCSKGRLDVFSGDEVDGLLEAPDVRPWGIKAEKVVDDELVIREKQERRAAQRRCVQKFSLLVAEHCLDDGDDVVGRFRAELPFSTVEVCNVSLAGEHSILAQPGLSGQDGFHEGVHLALILRAVLNSVVVRCGKHLLDLAVAEGRGLKLRPGFIQASRRQAELIAE